MRRLQATSSSSATANPLAPTPALLNATLQPPIRRERTFDHGAAIGFVADVGADSQRLAAVVLDQRDRCLRVRLVLIDDDNAAALVGEELRGCPADARNRRR